MLNFLHIQDGSISINIAQIVAIEWYIEEEEGASYAEILAGGEKFCCEDEDFEALKKLVGKA